MSAESMECSIDMSLGDSFLNDNAQGASAEDCFKTIDDRINFKIAEGLKKGARLIFQKINIAV